MLSQHFLREPIDRDGSNPEEKSSRSVPLHILVVDDYSDTARTMASVLGSKGFKVRCAQDGPFALELARAERPDAVLLDISMPGMDGLEVARRLHEMFPDRPPYLIAITAFDFDEDREACRQAGFDMHFAKPADPTELVHLLRELEDSSQ
jgi:CheY-like chemotaxis protein